MKTLADNMLKTIKNLSDTEKLKVVDALLVDLDKPDPEVDSLWADEAERRYKKFREGKIKTADYKQIKKRYRIR